MNIINGSTLPDIDIGASTSCKPAACTSGINIISFSREKLMKFFKEEGDTRGVLNLDDLQVYKEGVRIEL